MEGGKIYCKHLFFIITNIGGKNGTSFTIFASDVLAQNWQIEINNSRNRVLPQTVKIPIHFSIQWVILAMVL